MFDSNMELTELFRKSYKKLKAGVFFDKTQLKLRDKIVEYSFDDSFENLVDILKSEDWHKICSNIDYLSFPKKIEKRESEGLISNLNPDNTQIKELQYFLDMSVEGHILGVAWTLLVGSLVDGQIYEHSYGNRLKKKLLNEDGNPTYSPYLFEPYFQQYENWRDKALNYAQKSLNKKQDVIVLMLDFTRYFYNVNINKDQLIAIVNELLEDMQHNSYTEIAIPLTNFVFEVIQTYSNKLREVCPKLVGDRNVLPIGFYPSNVLSNYALKKFDDTVIKGWNPIYYGRYVDDIIIVEKVETNSDIYKYAKRGKLTSDNIIDYYLTYCDAWKKGFGCSGFNNGLLKRLPRKNTDTEFIVNPDFITFSGSKIVVQNRKVNILYFNSGNSDALIKGFREKLRNNKSEFRFLPEDVSAFQEDDYVEIYEIKEGTSPHVFRDVKDISVDKYRLSKYLGKYTRICELVHDKKETQFEKDIEKIFTSPVIIENYTAWEKVLAILITNEKYNHYLKFVKKVKKSIERMSLITEEKSEKKTQLALYYHLLSCVYRTASLVWGAEVDSLTDTISNLFENINGVYVKNFLKMRQAYCQTRMIDKYAVPIMIDELLCSQQTDNQLLSMQTVNLTDFNSIQNYITSSGLWRNNPKSDEDTTYKYYPYIVTMNDLCFNNHFKGLFTNSEPITIDEMKKLYIKINFINHSEEFNKNKIIEVKKINHNTNNYVFYTAIKLKDRAFTKIKIAVANTRLFEKNVENALNGKPNRTLKRYNDFVKIVNEAIKCEANMLVLPECYLPFEWIPIVSRTCAKNQLAVVTGVEYVLTEKKHSERTAVNLTSVILPYTEDGCKYSLINFHKKVHIAPNERIIFGSRNIEIEAGKSYELYNWNDFWFSVYCCYELASVNDRAIFQSYIDALIAVEWNKDTNYYSNIVESLSRDIHCFCVQVNTSEYGDSRITKPSKTESKNIIQVKGGQNSTVLVEELDFSALREFQIKGNLNQKNWSDLKQTPPGFDYDVVRYKITGQLWDKIK